MKPLLIIRWNQIVISLLIGFALGTVFGQWYARETFHARWKKGDMKQHMIERFSRKLHLSAEQEQAVAKIFEEKHAQMQRLHDEMRPKFETLRNATQTEIRKVLTPDQQAKFEKMNSEMGKRWKDRKGFPPPP